MSTQYKILIMGASYGSLLGTKLALAGHAVHLVCLPAEAELINKEGAVVRMPVKGREGLVEINSKKLPGKLTAGGTAGVRPSDYDLVALAMQEPQYRSPGVRELLDAVARAKVPCMSIMNMPPLMVLVLVTAIVAAPPQSKVTVPSKLLPPGRHAFSADSAQLAAVPVPTTHARADGGRLRHDRSRVSPNPPPRNLLPKG